MQCEIHRLTHDNAPALERLADGVFDYPIEPKHLAAFLDSANHVMFVALDDDVVVGMISAVELYHPDKPPQMYINEVGVTSSHRDNGIGRRLVSTVVDFARDKQCSVAWLATDITNRAAHRCFGAVPGLGEPQQFLLFEWELRQKSGPSADATTQLRNP